MLKNKLLVDKNKLRTYNGSMKNKMHLTGTKSRNSNRIHISSTDLNVRNEMHFNVQRWSRMNIFRDKKKYTRKSKHKNNFYC